MSWDASGALAEAIGALVVVISLVYLDGSIAREAWENNN